MHTKKRYTAPLIEVIQLVTEGLAVVPISDTEINNVATDDTRDPGSIDYDNSGELGGITPANSALWDDEEATGAYGHVLP